MSSSLWDKSSTAQPNPFETNTYQQKIAGEEITVLQRLARLESRLDELAATMGKTIQDIHVTINTIQKILG